MVGRNGLGPLRAQVSRKGAQFLFGQLELRHARLRIRGVVAVHSRVAAVVGDGARFFQPLVNPLPADLRADVGQVGPEHFGAVDVLQAMAAGAIQIGDQLAAAIELRSLRQDRRGGRCRRTPG